MNASTLPHNLDAERAVLGGLMLDATRYHDLADWLAAGDFYRRDHQLIFQAIAEQTGKGQPVDAVTLAEWFEGVELAQHVGGIAYLVELAQTTPSAANVTAYAEIVAEKSRLRRLAETGARIAEQAMLPAARSAAEVAAEAEAMLREIAPARTTGLDSIHGALRAAYAGFCDRFEGRADLGLPTPWEGLTRRYRLAPSEVTVLAGRPSMGKSVLGFQVASHLARLHGKRVALFSLESATVNVVNRMLADAGSVPYDHIRQPDPNRDDLTARLTAAMRELEAVKGLLHIDDTPALMAHQITARARRAHARTPVDLVVIDHLHELKYPGKPSDKGEEIGDACREFKRLAKELRIPVLLLAQLNRSAASEKRRPVLNDLRQAGAIEEVADGIIFIHRPDYYEAGDRPGLIELEIAKSREGERGVIVNLQNDYRHMRALDWVGPAPTVAAPTTARWGRASNA